MQIYLKPKPLTSLAQICYTFRRGKTTVRKWYNDGAPIAFHGGQYCAEYNALQAWLVENSKVKI